MTRSRKDITKVFTPFANPERQFQSRKDITPIAVHNMYSFYESESSESESADLNEIDIETLTLEQYLAQNHNNSKSRCGLTATEAMESIQEIVEHSHRWHRAESDKKTNSLSTITDKLKNLNHERNNLRVNIHKINLKSNIEFPYEEVKLNARCSAVFQNKLPPKEKDLGSFVLPCIIGNTTVSNALTDLGASICVIPSLQSPKGIVENVLVKIHKFIFLVDFFILDIVEDNKVPIIMGRPMLATAHPRIDVFGGKISLKVGKEQVIFNANEGATPVTVSPVCVIKDFDVIDNIEGPDNLEEFIMDDDLNGDLGNFLWDNNLFPNYENPLSNPPSLNKSPSRNWNPVEEFQDSDDNLGIGIDDFIAKDYLWDNLDPGSLTNKQPFKA
ncbi:putative reverse transcriptase domain-containing protein [Tanacetum coccineum]